MEIDEGKGSDRLGDYKAIKIKWQLSNRKKAPVDTLFYLYHDQPLITFEQTFSEAIPNTSVGDFETAITAFPCFSTEKGESSSLGYIAWGGIWHPMVKGKGLRDFTDELCRSTLQDCDPGAEGFPLVLYDENLNALVLSPLNNFMIGVQSTKPEGDLFSCGVEGEIKSIPEGFSYRTVLYAGKGINQALYEWGDTLLRWHGKKRTDPYADVGLSYLQYWTDNGAYYYYNTEKGKNYEETLLDVKSYLDEIGLPVRSFQLDSWWYFKEGEWALAPGSGVTLWEPKPDVFPNGIKTFHRKLGLPLIMHNRYWSPGMDKKYLENFQIVVEEGGACPVDREFWDYLMNWAKNEGCEIYEQDWLNKHLQNVEALRSDPYLARDWLLNMGSAAEERGMSIQYCMPLPRHFLQSTEIPSVTQIRVSGDYAPYLMGRELLDHWFIDQWEIGERSMLAWAVGLWPFKDVFWTTSKQPGHSGKYMIPPKELWPERQALVASLSGGPVAFGDGIGYTNKTLLMKTCREDGLLLKPDKPATPIDRAFTSNAPPAEVWDTYSTKGEKRWHYLFVYDQEEEFDLFPQDIGLKLDYVSYNFQTGEVKKLPKGSSLWIDMSQGKPWEYLVLAPIMENGMALIGDASKFVCAANKRVSDVEVKDGKLFIHAEGAPFEKTSLTLFSPETPKAIKADGRPIAREKWEYNKENNTIRFEIQFDSRGERTIEVMK